MSVYGIDRIYQIHESINNSILKDFKSKGRKDLGSFSKVKISEEIINKYKGNYKFLRHIRTGKNIKGYLFFDSGDKLVAILSVEEKDNNIWIQALEIQKEYQGYGLSKQLLKVATNEFKVNRLSVNRNNEIAIKIYKSYGFKEYESTQNMIFMKI